MKALILAGGQGTRLGLLTQRTPKVLVPVAGKPVLDHQLEWLKREGISEVVLLTGHGSDLVEKYGGNGSKWGLQITYRVEEKPLGTAGALKQLEGQLEEEFLVVYGDVIVDMDLESFVRFHQSRIDSCATLMVHPNDHPQDSDLIEFNDQYRITAFHGKPHSPHHFYHNQVNAAVYLLHPRIFSYLKKGEMLDLGRDVFPHLVQKENFYAYPSAEYLKDMGSIDRLEQVTKDIEMKKVSRWNRRYPRPAVFIDRDGVVCEHIDSLCDPDQLKIFADVVPAIKELNHSDYLAVMVTNQPGVSKGMITEIDVRRIHQKIETLLGQQGAYFHSIYFCPHYAPVQSVLEQPPYQIHCDCRKPGDGMIQRAAQFFNIDLSRSYMIGDTWRDIGAGRKAKLKSCLGIQKSKGRVGEFLSFPPDVLFSDLQSAIRFILG